MSDSSGSSGGSHNGLYMIVGALVVVVGLGTFLYFGGDMSGGNSGSSTTTIERTITPDGGEATTIKKD